MDTTNTTAASGAASLAAAEKLPRYTYGYKSDEWGENRTLQAYQDAAGPFLRREDVLSLLAAAPSGYSLDADPDGIRARAADAIMGVLAFGAQGTNRPPEGHWLTPFWEAAQAEIAARARVAPAAQEAEPAGYRISDPEEPEIGSWFSETPARAKYGLLSVPLYAHPPRPQADAGAVPAAQDQYLCQAWGETDLPLAAIVDGLDGVRAFLVAEWLGEDDGQSLSDVMDEMQRDWEAEGEAWKWFAEFEIGGVSVQKVCAAAPQAPAAAVAPAAAPTQEADGWMPIETAPDGERVLLGPRHAPVVGTVHRPAFWDEEQEPTATVVHYNGTTLVAGYRCSEWHRLPGAACGQEAEDAPIEWPKARDVGRIGDMSPSASFRVGLDSDNDVYVSVCGEDGMGSVEFCTPGAGGGKSSRTRVALLALMVAMEADNAEDPGRDWWAKRMGGVQPEGAQHER